MKPLDLLHDAVHLAGDRGLVAVPGFNFDYDGYVAKHCTAAAPGRLTHLATSKEHWPVWEVHPAGDELVVIVSGRAEFIQDVGGELRSVVVGPNQAIINPAGVPHTANVIEPFTAFYVTPAIGTEHRPRTTS